MKIAITTASGLLGRAIIKEAILKFGSNNIIGIARTPSKASDLGIEIREGDYNNSQHFIDAFQGMDLALIISGMDKPENRIKQHQNVINGAKAAGVKQIIYTSIFGREGKTLFDPVIKSNRQTEADVQNSGLNWVIGRNGLYIDPDLESLEEYKKQGNISNCAGQGLCAYTSRSELAAAYVNLMSDNSLWGQVYNLCGKAVTQKELTEAINNVYGLDLSYKKFSVEEYREDRIKAHGEFLGPIIAGIYQGILEGAFNVKSDYKQACGRNHLSLEDMIKQLRAESE